MNYALLGFGTVGVGVYEMTSRLENLTCAQVLVRSGKVRAAYQTDDFQSILENPAIEAVAEVMGGLHPAFEYLSAALQAGKHVVTANKQLVAAYGAELQALALKSGAAFLFSPACGGGIPFLHNLALAAQTDRISEVGGILNGTTNYMLDAMQRRGCSYACALADAQALGYAEAIPTADVGGLDAAAKLRLACGVAFDLLPQEEGLCVEGITSFTGEDVLDLQTRSLACRLIARAGRLDGRLYAFVEPALFPFGSAEAGLPDNYNLIRYQGENACDMTFSGQGAGRYPTASAVVRDLQDVLCGRRLMFSPRLRPGTADPTACSHAYYLRLPAALVDQVPCQRELTRSGGIVRLLTQPIPVGEMHRLAAALRNTGAEVFFAGIEA